MSQAGTDLYSLLSQSDQAQFHDHHDNSLMNITENDSSPSLIDGNNNIVNNIVNNMILPAVAAVAVAVAAVELNRNKRNRSKKSFVWDHVTLIETTGVVTCNRINQLNQTPCNWSCNYVARNGTTNIKNHLNSAHKVDEDSVILSSESVDRTQSIISFDPNLKALVSVNTMVFQPERSKTLLHEMVILDELSFNLVEHIGFKNFIQSLRNPTEFKIPGRKAVQANCFKMVNGMRPKVKVYLCAPGNGKRTITTDIWTSNQTKSYMAVTIHFINALFQLCNLIINFEYFKAPHTGVRIAGVYIYNIYSQTIESIY